MVNKRTTTDPTTDDEGSSATHLHAPPSEASSTDDPYADNGALDAIVDCRGGAAVVLVDHEDCDCPEDDKLDRLCLLCGLRWRYGSDRLHPLSLALVDTPSFRGWRSIDIS